MRNSHPTAAGFTLMEVLVSVGIFGMLLGLIMVRYNRGNEDSVLVRQAAVLVSDIRLAQEQTAGGATVRYCTDDTGETCTANGDCPSVTCNEATTPPGGMALLFSCPTAYTPEQLYFSQDEQTTYYTYADAVVCSKETSSCFPPSWLDGTGWQPGATDGWVSSYLLGGNLKGDPLVQTHSLARTVEVKDLQLVEILENGTEVPFRCADGARPTGGSPWNGQSETVNNELVPADYPLQVLLRFPGPSGRETVISDNISTVTYASLGYGTAGNPWGRADIMLGLTTRTIDCRVISMTKDGVISQRIDSDCNFAT